jgi:hypothetical protein
MMLLAVMVALAALMLAAAPAMASPKHDGSKGHEGNWDRWDNNNGNWDPWDNNNGNWDPWNNNNGNCDPWDNNNGNWDPWNNNHGNCHPFDNVTPQVQVPTQTYVSGSNTINGGSVTSTGDNSNTCVATQNFNNSGGVLDQPSIQQQHSGIGSTVFIGGTFVNAPQQNVTCNPSVQQSASSSSGWDSGWNSGWST